MKLTYIVPLSHLRGATAFTVDYKGVNKKTNQHNLEKKLDKKIEPLSEERRKIKMK